MSREESAFPSAFEVTLAASSDGLEFEPGVFAAPKDESREMWILELEKLQTSGSSKEFKKHNKRSCQELRPLVPIVPPGMRAGSSESVEKCRWDSER